jgi:hypothetical protein
MFGIPKILAIRVQTLCHLRKSVKSVFPSLPLW